MTQPLQPFLHDLVTVLAAPTQVLSARTGEVGADADRAGAQGVLHADVRVLSRVVVEVDGLPGEHVATESADPRRRASRPCCGTSVHGLTTAPDPSLRLDRERDGRARGGRGAAAAELRPRRGRPRHRDGVLRRRPGRGRDDQDRPPGGAGAVRRAGRAGPLGGRRSRGDPHRRGRHLVGGAGRHRRAGVLGGARPRPRRRRGGLAAGGRRPGRRRRRGHGAVDPRRTAARAGLPAGAVAAPLRWRTWTGCGWPARRHRPTSSSPPARPGT